MLRTYLLSSSFIVRSRTKRRFGKGAYACIVFVLWAATTITAPAQTFDTLLNFDGTDGATPYLGSLVRSLDGSFYGTTSVGGAHNMGTVFKIELNGTLTTLHSFCSTSGCPDGAVPASGLALASNGNFYGTTTTGGKFSFGTVFEITPGGTLTTLHNFDLTDGSTPRGALIPASDGNLYGTTFGGGAFCGGLGGCGTVFKITPGGTFNTLHSFSGYPTSDGAAPYAGLVEGSNGILYGTTSGGGVHDGGVIYEITTAGKVTTLYAFEGGFPSTGSSPWAPLIQSSNGLFYGTTSAGGTNGAGAVFKITTGGALTDLHSFCNTSTCTDGANPQAPLIQATDGNFYGTTTACGASNCHGIVFRISPAGSFNILHSFDGTDGNEPHGGLLQDTTGSLYGMTQSGGTKNDGTVYSLGVGLSPFLDIQPTSGIVGTKVTILGTNLSGASSVSFNGVTASFTVISSSEIKATTPAAATTGKVQVKTGSGTITSNVTFRVTPQITSFTPTSGAPGATVTITGVTLTGTTKVTFGSVAATSFKVISNTEVTATVPTGAKTGKITVSTPGGTATSTVTFTVT